MSAIGQGYSLFKEHRSGRTDGATRFGLSIGIGNGGSSEKLEICEVGPRRLSVVGEGGRRRAAGVTDNDDSWPVLGRGR